jgi:hypothetical protein
MSPIVCSRGDRRSPMVLSAQAAPTTTDSALEPNLLTINPSWTWSPPNCRNKSSNTNFQSSKTNLDLSSSATFELEQQCGVCKRRQGNDGA